MASEAVVTLTSRDETAKGVKSAKANFRSLSKDVEKLSVGQVAALGGIGIAVQQSVQRFAEFDNQVREIGTLLDDVTDNSLNVMGEEIKDLSIEFGQNIDRMAKARYDAISAGFSGAADSALLLENASKLAVGGVSEVSRTTDVLTSILNSYNKTAQESGKVSDILFTTVRLGKTTINELASGMGTAAAIAPTLGIEFEELSAAVATLTAGGQSTGESITAMTGTMTAFLSPSKAMQARLNELGFETGAAAVKSLGFNEALKAVTEGANEAEKAALFPNIRAMRAVFPLVGSAAKTYEENLLEMNKAAGATDVAFEKIASGPAFRLNQTMARVEKLTIEVGEALLPLVEKVLDGVEAFTDLSEGTQQFVVVGSAAIPVVKSLFNVVGSLIGVVRTLGALTGPIGAALAGIGTVAALFVEYELEVAAARRETDEFIASIRGFSLEQIDSEVEKVNAQLVSAESQIEKYDSTLNAIAANQSETGKLLIKPFELVADQIGELIKSSSNAEFVVSSLFGLVGIEYEKLKKQGLELGVLLVAPFRFASQALEEFIDSGFDLQRLGEIWDSVFESPIAQVQLEEVQKRIDALNFERFRAGLRELSLAELESELIATNDVINQLEESVKKYTKEQEEIGNLQNASQIEELSAKLETLLAKEQAITAEIKRQKAERNTDNEGGGDSPSSGAVRLAVVPDFTAFANGFSDLKESLQNEIAELQANIALDDGVGIDTAKDREQLEQLQAKLGNLDQTFLNVARQELNIEIPEDIADNIGAIDQLIAEVDSRITDPRKFGIDTDEGQEALLAFRDFITQNNSELLDLYEDDVENYAASRARQREESILHQDMLKEFKDQYMLDEFDREMQHLEELRNLLIEHGIATEEIERTIGQRQLQIDIAKWAKRVQIAANAANQIFSVAVRIGQDTKERLRKDLDEKLSLEERSYQRREAALRKKLTVDGKLTAKGQQEIEKLKQSHEAKKDAIRKSALEREKAELSKFKAVKVAQAISNTALAVTRALSLPWPLNLAIAATVGALGAVEVSRIAAQPFQEGGIVQLPDGGKVPNRPINRQLTTFVPQGTDSVPAILTPGEAVINKSQFAKNRDIVQRILAGEIIQPQPANPFEDGGFLKAQFLFHHPLTSRFGFYKFDPQGTDTVPALLPSGVAVVSKPKFDKNRDIIEQILAGEQVRPATPFVDGGIVGDDDALPASGSLSERGDDFLLPPEVVTEGPAQGEAPPQIINNMTVIFNGFTDDTAPRIMDTPQFIRTFGDMVNNGQIRIVINNEQAEVLT